MFQHLLGVTAGSLAALVLLPGTAVAAPSASGSFGLNTDRTGTDGFAHGDGRIRFLNRTTVRIASHVSDRCGAGAGDGEGAYAWAQLYYADGTSDAGRTLSLNFDDDGCGNNTRTHAVTFPAGRTIESVRIRLDESDGPSGTSSSTVYSTTADNPYS